MKNTTTYNQMVNANSMVIAGKKLGLIPTTEMFIKEQFSQK